MYETKVECSLCGALVCTESLFKEPILLVSICSGCLQDLDEELERKLWE